MRRPNGWPFALSHVTLVLLGAHVVGLASVAGAVCVGDCNGDGKVTIAEVQRCVNLGNGIPSAACANADQNLDLQVDQMEIEACIQSFLDTANCPMIFTPAPTGTRTPLPSQTNTPLPTGTRTPTATGVPTNTNTPLPTSTSTPLPTATSTMGPIGTHRCNLGGTIADSFITLHAALPLAPFATAGAAVDLSCGTIGANGKAPCNCSVQSFPPLLISGIFWACVKPTTATCPAGEVDCNGGNAMGLSVEAHRNIGTCTGNADCLTQCTTLCAASGKVPFGVPSAGQCEGFCTLGTQSACTTDAQCLALDEGSCNGPDGLGFGHVCDCTCVNDSAGPAGVVGELSCQLAFNLTVEPNPGNGQACDGGDVSIRVGDTCAPMTTAAASGIIMNANNAGGTFPAGAPFSASGAPANCTALTASTTTGLKLVGGTAFYASTIGDILAQISAKCN